jgi:hypothetical protein
MNWRGIPASLWLVLFGLTACGPSLLDRRMEISKVTPADCPHADALVEEYAGAGALPSEVRTVRAHVNAVCASEAYTQGNLDQAEGRAKRALDDEPGNSLAQDILKQVAERRQAGPPPSGP